MNNYDEIANIIEDINAKIKEIDKQMILVEDIKPNFNNMDTYIPELESAYQEFDTSLSNGIFRTQELNKIVAEEAINEYYDIFQELSSKCTDIMNELVESVEVLKNPVEVIVDTSPIEPSTSIVDHNLFINEDLTEVRIISKKTNPRDVIELPPQPIREIEVLEM